MTYAEWFAAREQLAADLTACRRGPNDQATLDALGKRERDLREGVERHYALSDRGYVLVACRWWKRPPETMVTIRDDSRFQQCTMVVDEDALTTRLTADEIEIAYRMRDRMHRWIDGTIAEMPAGIAREEATAPWRP